jgi:peptide/nickel transport system permease protein
MSGSIRKPVLSDINPLPVPARALRQARPILPLVALVLVILVVVAAVCAPLISPYQPLQGDIMNNLRAPTIAAGLGFPHLLGTDMLGRDVLSGVVHGARVSLLVGIASVVGAGLLGTALGILAGYFGGWLEEVVMRVVDVQLAFPFILLAIVIMYVLGRGLGNVIVVLIIASWPLYARVARAQALRLRASEFVLAARSLGAGWPRILWRHILPNALTPLLVVATFAIPQMIIFEAALSFLGVGMPLEVVSWGSMLASGRNYLEQAWWVATWPGLAIMLTVLSVNILGDWLRDRLDPSLHLA